VGAIWWVWGRRDTDDETVEPILPPKRVAVRPEHADDDEDEEAWGDVEENEEDEEDDGLADLEPEDREGLLAGMGVMIQQEMRRLLDKKQNAPAKFTAKDQRDLDRVSQEYLDLQATRRRYGIAETEDDPNGVAWDADDLDDFGDDYFGDEATWGDVGDDLYGDAEEESAGNDEWETDSDDVAPPKNSKRPGRR
jgi:hypothetical protein